MDLQVVVDALTQIYNDIFSLMPDVVNGLIVLLVGYVVARVVGWTDLDRRTFPKHR